MPKVVDHDARRRDLVSATWRIIARGGFAAATLQSVETEAGYAHGIVRHYFTSKDELLASAFDTAYRHTIERAQRAIGDDRGLAALRKLCLELLPLDGERLVEAKVVVAFWDHAANNAPLAGVHADAVATWERLFLQYLVEACEQGELATGIPLELVAQQLLLIVNGAQVGPVVTPSGADTDSYADMLTEVLDWLLTTVRTPPAAGV